MLATPGVRLLSRGAALLLCSFILATQAVAEWSRDLGGRVGVQALGFWRDPLQQEQHNLYLSAVAEPEFYTESGNGEQSFRFQPFQRVAQHDGHWTHTDIRELSYTHVADFWERTVGISKVFWGVTEARHLVDIINQTDFVENPDGEDKLGQPMFKLSLVPAAGTLDLFVLPYFRERSFPGDQGRPRALLVVDTGNPVYDSSDKQKHIDFAARWSQSLGEWDLGLSHFYGTSRTPVFLLDNSRPGAPVLVPRYDIIHQTGLEVQTVMGSWLLKFEGIYVSGAEHDYEAVDTGFEYTFPTLESGMEIGALMEYLYDSRDDAQLSVSQATQFQNDIFVGSRLTFNDVQSTQLLGGLIFDTQGDGHSYNLEASRRVGESYLLSVEIRGVFDTSEGDFLYQNRKDQSVRLELDYFL
jgi:hypothetical protein